MYIKIKHIFIVIIVLIIIIIGLIFCKYKFNDNKLIEGEKVADVEEQKYDMYFANSGDGRYEICYEVAKKNGNWSKLPLTENFRKKYNENDGILGSIQYDSIEYRPYAGSDEDYYFKDENYFVITQGQSKTLYRCLPTFDEKGVGELLEDVYLYDIKQLYDENGNKLIVDGRPIEELYSFYFLANGGDDEKSVAVTPSFHAKYPFFLDIFEHYSPLRFNHIEFVPERSSWERKEAYFIVDSVLECKKRNYKVNFTLDSKGYLDDVKVIKVNEEEYEGSSDEIAAKLLYENSNWDELKITDNYKKKYNGQSYNSNIEEINIDYEANGEYVEKENYYEYLWQYKMKDGTTSVYYIKYIIDDQGYIDDIECTKLNYDNVPIEEAKELYLKEYSK